MVVPAFLALAALVVAAAVVAILGNGGSGAGKKPTGTATTTAHGSSHRPSTTTSARSTTTSARSTTTSGRSTTTIAGSTGTTGSTTPAAAVEQFYTDAAAHRYPEAWALAGQSLRSELGGYAAFQNQMNSVRSITFRRAAALPGSGSSTATVALQTTSVQTDRTQQCTGTARAVRAGGGWLVDGVSISCS